MASARSIEPKKVKGRCWDPGLALRRRLLIDRGLPETVVNAAPPRGAAPDDLLDALLAPRSRDAFTPAWRGRSPIHRSAMHSA